MPRVHIIIIVLIFFLLSMPIFADEETANETVRRITVDQALDLARGQNLELKAAYQGVAAAQFGVTAARALDWFTLSLNNQGRQTGPPISTDISGVGEVVIIPSDFQSTASLTLTQPVLTFGLNKRLKQIAGLSLATAQTEYETRLDDIQFQVESAYYDLVYLELLLDVQGQDLERVENDKRIAELRYKAGQVARFEVIRTDVTVKNSEEVLLGTRKALAVAKLAWNRLLGVDEYHAPIKINPDDIDPVSLSFTMGLAQEMALTMRPELIGFRLGVDLAVISAKLKNLRPDLRFIWSYNITDVDTAFTSNSNWSILFNLEVPLWDGGKAKAEARQGFLQAEQLNFLEKDLEEIIEIEVADAYLAVEESIERIRATSATLELAQEAKRMAEVGYREGAVILQDVLSAEVELSSALANRLGAVYDYLKANAQLRKAMGVDSFPESNSQE